MNVFIKLVIMFVLLFILFYPLSIVMDTTFTSIDNISSTYGNTTADPTNFTGNITTHTSFFGTVFRLIYSFAGISAVASMLIFMFVRKKENDLYEY